MNLQLTTNYLLLIDKEAETKEKGYYTNNSGQIILKSNGGYKRGFLKVIAYYPLTSEAKELHLPLLPPFEEIYIEELAKQHLQKWRGLNNIHLSNIIHADRCRNDFIAGYKAAQPKQFSLENIKPLQELLDEGYDAYDTSHHLQVQRMLTVIEKFIQSLSTQQLPVNFIPDYENKCWCLKPMSGGCFECTKMLKTITNLEGNQELVGIYKY